MTLYRLTAHHDHEGLAGLVSPLGGEPGDPFAGILDGNILAADPPALPTDIPGARLIVWSGTLAQTAMFDRDPSTWMAQGLDAFRAACDALAPFLEAAGARILFRPHARHVLCDPRRCLTLATDWRDAGAPFSIILDAAAMLESPMLDTAEDHLLRAFEMLAPVAEAVILANAEPHPGAQSPDDDAPPPLLPAPLHAGAIDPTLIVRPWRQLIPDGVPTILIDADIPAQRRLIDAIP